MAERPTNRVLLDSERLAALQATGLFNAEPVPAFDRLTRAAARALRAPVAQVNLVSEDQQVAKARFGPEPWASRGMVSLDYSYCQHVVDAGKPLAVEDTREDPLTRDSLAITEFGILAYAAVPLSTVRGHTLGSLCVLDFHPRQWGPEEVQILEDLAAVAVVEIEERLRADAEAEAAREEARYLAHRALHESESRFRALANNIPQLAWMTNEAGWIFWYNQRWYDYTGTTFEEMEGWGWRKVHHPDHLNRVLERFRSAIEHGESWEDTFPLQSKTGEYRWFLSRAMPMRDESGRVVRWLGTNTDITEQLEAERARDRALQEAEAANRAKMEFLSAMSHELRTPLNGIGGYVDLLELGIYGETTAEQLQALERIRSNQKSLLVLINDILHFAKIEAGKIEYEIQGVSVSELLSEVETIIELQAGEVGFSHTVGSCDSTLLVRADPERIRQILRNLLTNAVKYTPSGGQVSLFCEEWDGRVDIRVRDTGRGVPAEMVERIFDPFVQVQRNRYESSQQGVGLGLAISRDLARGMGGDLTVESTLGHGSTFTLSLPVWRGEAADEERRAGAPHVGGLRRQNGGILDDGAAARVATDP